MTKNHNTVQGDNVLQVRTLGRFSIQYGGVEIADGKQGESQFGLLMQLLLHHRENGVNRNLMKETLFEDRDIEDISHSIRNIIYNAKRRLKSSGIPDGTLITQKSGVYFWTDEVPVEEDARLFETAYSEAVAEQDKEAQMVRLWDACHLYAGTFLKGYEGVSWVFQEQKRYRNLFHECVNRTADLLREGDKYKLLLELSRFATNVDPFSEWEVLSMEALIALGRYDDAERFFDTAVETYVAEYGNRSAQAVRDVSRKLSQELQYSYETLDEIQGKLTNETKIGGRGYYVSYPVFVELYRNVERIMERSGEYIFLMLCTVVDSKGNPMREGPKLDELSARLEKAVIQSVRHSDTVTRYGKGQFLVLLFNTTRENCKIIEDRIDSHFLVGKQRTGVEYSVNSVILSKFDFTQK